MCGCSNQNEEWKGSLGFGIFEIELHLDIINNNFKLLRIPKSMHPELKKLFLLNIYTSHLPQF